MSDKLFIPSRRRFLAGLGVGIATLVCAPALVRASSLMPVRAIPEKIQVLAAAPWLQHVGMITLDGDGVARWTDTGAPVAREAEIVSEGLPDPDSLELTKWQKRAVDFREGNWLASPTRLLMTESF